MAMTQGLVVSAISILIGLTTGQSPDRPARGVWEFNPQPVWEINRVGNEPLTRPGEIRVAPGGKFYFHDFERHVSYACDSQGALVASFAKQGSGKGDVSRYMNCLTDGDQVVIAAPDKLHIFTSEGAYISSRANDVFQRFPLLYLAGEAFFLGPGALTDVRGDKAEIVRSGVSGGEETVFARLPVSRKDREGPPGAVIVGLTPQVLMARDGDRGVFYYGKNSKYKIHTADADGKEISVFGVKRAKVRVSKEAKKAHFDALGVPPERADRLVDALPGEAAYYHRIQVNQGLVYVFTVAGIGERQDSQSIDIFSPDGTYLYDGHIKLSNGKHVRSSPDNLRIQDDQLYVILEDDQGGKTIAKYGITLPPAEAP